MTVFILLGSDDYIAHQILDVFDNRAGAEQAIADNKKARTVDEMRYRLISRQGEPHYKIVERVVCSK